MSNLSYVTVDWQVPVSVIPRLWLGKVDADSLEMLRDMQVTHVLFLTERPGLDLSDIEVKEVNEPDDDLIFSWMECLEFIASGRRCGGVIVDVSNSPRSASTVVAYLVEALGMTLDGAMMTIRRALRDLAEPRGVLIEQLQAVERWCRDHALRQEIGS